MLQVSQYDQITYQFSHEDLPPNLYTAYMIIHGAEKQKFLPSDRNMLFTINPEKLQIPVGDYSYYIYIRCDRGFWGTNFVEKNLLQITE
jgi:hypothetical protein